VHMLLSIRLYLCFAYAIVIHSNPNRFGDTPCGTGSGIRSVQSAMIPPRPCRSSPKRLERSSIVAARNGRISRRGGSTDRRREILAAAARAFRIFAVAYLASPWAVSSSAQELHFSPEEKLDAIDAALIAEATRTIDFASYSLTDSTVLAALLDAERRGVVIRIVLDPRERHDFITLGDLSDNVRIKRGGPFMHLKSYAIDGQLLRSGSANFSASGERQQDNDLIVIRNANAPAEFEAHFEQMWVSAQPMIEFEPAIRALEPK
jgi:phosphatidylserine/phosphatidylglycerophosphate/cardiolipin synthase-like enzyme